MIALANAPVSYGVFEFGSEGGASLPGPDRFCAMVAAAGYAGVDSGPIGWLGREGELRSRLRAHGLAVAGGWVDLPFSDPAAFEAALPDYALALEFFAEAAAAATGLPPRPTLADSGSPGRRANPGGRDAPRLSDREWDVLATNVTHAAALAEQTGLRATFHHHACTYVETPDEIDELLARTDIGLTLDTGHLLLGGGDPVAGLERWADRIDHIHVKDARRDVLAAVIAGRGGMREVWTSRAFVPLRDGDLDLDAVMSWILSSGYEGWLVVEQDAVPLPDDDPDRAQSDQVHNREALREWLP